MAEALQCYSTPAEPVDTAADLGLQRSESSVDRDIGWTVLKKGMTLSYTVPSIHVYIREVKLQYVAQTANGDSEVIVFDGFMRECGLINHPLPATANVPCSYEVPSS